jgi:glutathione S-transferase
MSPYCLKVETWLRLVELKYENVDHKMKLRSKKGQLPFVELNGEEIADSAIILKELGQQFGKDLDAGLTNEQKDVSHAMISMIENHLVWVVTWWRTKYPDNVINGYKMNLQRALGTRIPNGILNFLFKFSFARKGAKKVKAQGMGRHKAEEIMEFGQNDLKVLSNMLADKPFFFGNDVTTLDIVAFASLGQIYFIDEEVQYSLRDYMQESCPNLVGHVNRMKEKCFSNWEIMCKTLDLNAHPPKPPPEEKENKEEKKEEMKEKEGDKEIGKETEEIKKSEEEEKEVETEVEGNK